VNFEEIPENLKFEALPYRLYELSAASLKSSLAALRKLRGQLRILLLYKTYLI
jgi:hypothetical protein